MSEPIVTAASVWDLDATPATLEKTAESLRGLSRTTTSSQATVNSAARQVDGEGSWEGETAQAYQTHQTRLTNDLGELGKLTLSAAAALESVASVLRTSQNLLDEQRRKLSHVKATTSEGWVTFHPCDDAGAASVRKAVSEANEIRQWAEENIASNMAYCAVQQVLLGMIIGSWQPRALRIMDLNAGQGSGNGPRDKEGTDLEDIDDLGRTILRNNPNVVTVQEMFGGDAETLKTWLNEHTNGEWELHYAAASHKWQGDRLDNDSFGNAVLVRKGSGITSSEELPEVTLEEPGNFGLFGAGPEGRSMEGARITVGG